MNTRVTKLVLAADGGSQSVTIGIAPSRYAGAYFTCDPSNLSPDVSITNMGRALTTESAVADDFLAELLPTDEMLTDGDVVIAAGGASEAGTLTVRTFHHFAR